MKWRYSLRLSQKFLPKAFLSIASKYPDRPALVVGDTVWTYSLLLKHAQQIAFVLHNKYNIGPGKFVMLMISKTHSSAFTSMLAVLLVGACYVPVDDKKCPIERAGLIFLLKLTCVTMPMYQ